jgi:tRNA (guanine37-N1)-methyltransferase
MQFDIITIFPDLFNSFLQESLIKKALNKGVFSINIHNLRDYTNDKHKQVDDEPFGGGAGMVLQAEPIIKAIADIKLKNKQTKVILFSPTGDQFTQQQAWQDTQLDQIIMICGRYEGIDARVEEFIDQKVSIGPYVLSGGEIPSMVLIEAVGRLLPGYMGNFQSVVDESHAEEGVLEYPQYTRPETLVIDDKEYKVPPVLLSGNHAEIEKWRLASKQIASSKKQETKK